MIPLESFEEKVSRKWETYEGKTNSQSKHYTERVFRIEDNKQMLTTRLMICVFIILSTDKALLNAMGHLVENLHHLCL